MAFSRLVMSRLVCKDMMAECKGSAREYDGSCEDKERTVHGGVDPARCMTLCYTHVIIFYSSNKPVVLDSIIS